MTSAMFLAEWAIRSSILILTGALLIWLVRVKDPSIRWASWTALLVGSLMIPVMSAVLPGVPLIVKTIPADAVPPPVAMSKAEAPPEIPPAPSAFSIDPHDSVPAPPLDWAGVAVLAYGLIALGFLVRLGVGLVMSRRMLHSARLTRQLADGTEVRESGRVHAPVTVGILRPVILLPVDWGEWEEVTLDAILAHETSHIRRYDPVVQLVSAIHRSLLWFSPMSWFLHARIVRLAEDASDDAAVTAMGDRAAYAEVLMNFVQRGLHRRDGTAQLPGVPMARNGGMSNRIHRILDGTTLSRGITRWSAAAIVTVASPLAVIVALAYPRTETIPPPPLPISHLSISHTAVNESRITPSIVNPEQPHATPLIAQASVPLPIQAPAVEKPKFDVASIKPCDPDAPAPGGRGGRTAGSIGRLSMPCMNVMSLIRAAYVRFADGKGGSLLLMPVTKIEGGPAWLTSDQYKIEVESEGNPPVPMMFGPMMQSLLEDRFQLKLHRETREGPVYNLTVAKGGSKIQPAKGTPCSAADLGSGFPVPPAGAVMPCKLLSNDKKGLNIIVTARGVSMEELISSFFTPFSDRLVVDKTSITGAVDLRLVFAADENSPDLPQTSTPDAAGVAVDPVGPDIFTAVQQQLGLKLEPGKGSREYLVIDSISRPSPN